MKAKHAQLDPRNRGYGREDQFVIIYISHEHMNIKIDLKLQN